MSLYFETEMQGISFLLLCAAGFALALVFDGVSMLIPGPFKIAGDILLFIISGLVFLGALFFLREGDLRYFHWLALLAGAILYTCGVRRIVGFGMEKIKEWKAKRKR